MSRHGYLAERPNSDHEFISVISGDVFSAVQMVWSLPLLHVRERTNLEGRHVNLYGRVHNLFVQLSTKSPKECKAV